MGDVGEGSIDGSDERGAFDAGGFHGSGLDDSEGVAKEEMLEGGRWVWSGLVWYGGKEGMEGDGKSRMDGYGCYLQTLRTVCDTAGAEIGDLEGNVALRSDDGSRCDGHGDGGDNSGSKLHVGGLDCIID